MSGAVTENEIELARTAEEAFDAHRYEGCLSTLNKLQESRKQDGRVAHNRAVAQYMLSNLTLTDGFRKALQSVNSQVEITHWLYIYGALYVKQTPQNFKY